MNFEISDKSTEAYLNWNDARFYCFSLGGGWRLPTKEELNEIYHSENDFERKFYWSSTEVNGSHAWIQYFYSGGQGSDNKNFGVNYVRVVRDLKDN